MFSAENFILQLVHVLSQLILVQFALEMCLAARNRQKFIKPLFWHSMSSKVIELGAN